MYKKGGKKSSKNKNSFIEKSKEITFGNKPMMKGYGGMKYKAGGFPDLTGDGKVTKADVLKGRGVDMKKSGGKKSMEPGGGGRFAAMVAGLKKKGKSEDSAKAIAATIGRNKYGKKKFQEMAAKGKKGLGGMSDSTSANDAGMEMMEDMVSDRGKKNASAEARKRGRKARRRQRKGKTGCWSGECTGPEMI